LPENLPEIQFRPYRIQDLPRCAQLAAEAWPVKEHITQELDKTRIMEPYVEIAAAWSNWTDIAYLDSGEIIGVIFGDTRTKDSRGAGRRLIASEIRACARILLGRYGKVRRLPSLLWNFMMTEMKLLVNRPEADAEIMLLLVDSTHRGKGLGRTMVDRFVNNALDAGSRRVSVYADDLASNWHFYESYGFKREGLFFDNWSTYYNGERSMGIRFILDLDRWHRT
jgi:GNAT superfamily N-acetyltransferase